MRMTLTLLLGIVPLYIKDEAIMLMCLSIL